MFAWRADFVTSLRVYKPFGAARTYLAQTTSPAVLATVLEAVGVLLLAAPLPRDTVLAALLAYRALYYFAPLVLAALAFGIMELRQRQSASRPEKPR